MKIFKLVSIIVLFCSGIFFSQNVLQSLKPLSKSSQFIKPPPFLEHLTFGHNEIVADFLWLRAIQDIDHCEKVKSENSSCDGSWLGEMLIRITDLSPRFRMVYALGPLALSVMIDDLPSAIKIIERAEIYFPNDWPILYRAAYVFLFDIKDKSRAADYFVRAGRAGAPTWVFSLASRLYQEAGEFEKSDFLMAEAEKNGIPKEIIERMKRKFLRKTKDSKAIN